MIKPASFYFVLKQTTLLLLSLASLKAGEITYEANADYSFVGNDRMQNNRILSEQNNQLHFVISKPIGVDRLLRIGAEWQRYSLSTLPGAARLPNTLQSANLILGMDMELWGWLVRLETQPGFYGDFQQADVNGFNIPFILGGVYLVNSDLQWVAGVSMNSTRNIPVLPAAGVRWKFSKDWVMNAVMPRPRMEYSLTPSTLLYGGGDFKLGTYRMDSSFGNDHGNPHLNNVLLDYTEIRIGGGAEIKINASTRIDLETGSMIYRQFDYYRAHLCTGNNSGAAYGQIMVNCSF